MIIRLPKTVDSGGSGKEYKVAENQATPDSEESCRCKEASKMTPRELLRLMMSDLIFWKKTKKG